LEGKGTGIQWISGKSLEDLEYADDLALLSYSPSQMQVKTKSLEEIAMLVELRVNKDKTKIMKVKTDSSQTVTLANGSIEEIKEFTYLESLVKVPRIGGTEQDVEARLGKARTVYREVDK